MTLTPQSCLVLHAYTITVLSSIKYGSLEFSADDYRRHVKVMYFSV